MDTTGTAEEETALTAPELIAEADGLVLRVWLNRPANLNSLTAGVLEELIELFGSLRPRPEVRVVVLGGVGRSFSAGADRDMLNDALATHRISPGHEAWWIADLGRRAARAIEDAAAATVARLHGYVAGGAAVLALACDIRVAADDTLIWLPEVSPGIPLTWGGLPRLIQEAGAARARQLVLAGDKIGAEVAREMGAAARGSASRKARPGGKRAGGQARPPACARRCADKGAVARAIVSDPYGRANGVRC